MIICRSVVVADRTYACYMLRLATSCSGDIRSEEQALGFERSKIMGSIFWGLDLWLELMVTELGIIRRAWLSFFPAFHHFRRADQLVSHQFPYCLWYVNYRVCKCG
jgi:hypothetical protein